MPGVQVQSLVRELRSYMPPGVTKKYKQTNKAQHFCRVRGIVERKNSELEVTESLLKWKFTEGQDGLSP